MSTTKTSAQVPRLRFPGFDGEWEQVALGEATKVIDCKHRTPQYVEKGVPIISPGTIKWGPLDVVTPTKRVTEEEYVSLMDHCDPQLNDLVLSRNQSMGVASRIMTREKFVLGQDTVLIQQRNGNGGIIFFRLQTEGTQGVIGKLSGGSTFSRINLKDIRQIPLILPTERDEQRKIADFLTAVDRRIGQLSQKKSLLEDYKKGVMQQLFTQTLRFKDDHGHEFPDWEEKTLGAIASFSKGCGISKAEVHEDGVLPCIRYGELYTHYAELIRDVKSRTNVPEKDLVLSQRNDVIIPASGETHIDIATASCVTVDGVALGGDLNIIRTKQNGVFLAYYLNNACKHAIAGMAQGSSVIHLYPDQLKRLRLHLPSVKEQTKIANFLSALDRKIESVAQQITHTQAFKKGLLQQMFV
jgi:type I restriction enzyme S subunit